ncbi:MAG: rhomboid family intramembrane serine protease [Polyangiaceae bacterium]
MFIVPIAHEHSTARRLPFVTLAVIVVNLLAFVALGQVAKPAEARALQALELASTFYEQHSYLSLKCVSLRADDYGPKVAPPVDEEERVAEEQRSLDELCAKADDAVFALPTHRFGYVPARGVGLSLVTHQFLHGGWLHLLFNMWFLWLAGVNLEDRWGRAVFPVFYLLCGAIGALGHHAANASSWTPMIGASGAVAGAMGAFFVVFGSAEIRFFYIFFITFRPKVGTFGARAYVMLPLWLGLEVLYGLVTPRDGVAHWAHVAGFLTGAAVAFALKLSKLDKKLDDSVERRATLRVEGRVVEARTLADEGRPADAVPLLLRICGEDPNDIDARLELIRVATMLGDSGLRARATVDAALAYLNTGAIATSVDLVLELMRSGLATHASADRMMRLGERLVVKQEMDLAGQVFAAIHQRTARDDAGVRAALAHASLLSKKGDHAGANQLLEVARKGPDMSADTRERLEVVSAQVARAAQSRTGM